MRPAVTIDGGALLLAALADPEARAALAELLEQAAEAGARRALAERATDPLMPLAGLLGCSAAAARMREQRDPKLRALARVEGRRRLYRRSEVEQHLGADRPGSATTPEQRAALERGRAKRMEGRTNGATVLTGGGAR